MLPQRLLNLPINHRTVLVTMEMVRANLGVDAESVQAKVDAGEIRWIWNVATGERISELRFWAKELIAPEFCAGLNLEQVINQLLGEVRLIWRGVEIEHLLLVSRPTVKKLCDEGALAGEIVGGTFHFRRAAVVNFLRARLTTHFSLAPGSSSGQPISVTRNKSRRSELPAPKNILRKKLTLP